MKIAKKLFVLAVLIIFCSNCFGAVFIEFEKFGYTLKVRDDGIVALIDNDNKDRWWYYSKEKIIGQEIFEFDKNNISLNNYFLIFPIGLYSLNGFLTSSISNHKEPLFALQYKQNYDYGSCFSKIDKFFFFLDKSKNRLYFAHEGNRTMIEYSLDIGFKMFGIQFSRNLNVDSIIIWGQDLIHDDHYLYLKLDEINKKYSESLSNEFAEFEVL